jgi:hypothetical protein
MTSSICAIMLTKWQFLRAYSLMPNNAITTRAESSSLDLTSLLKSSPSFVYMLT